MDREEQELKRIAAETEKLRREAKSLKRTKWDRLGDAMKVFGAVAATVIAGAAAVTTYRITQLEAKLAQKERQEAEAELNKVSREVASLKLSKAQVETELAAARSRVASAQAELSKITPQTTPAAVASSINQARGALSAVSQHATVAPFAFIVPSSSGQNDSARKTAELLKSRGFETYIRSPLPDPSHAPDTTEVRYFRHPGDRPVAVSVLEVLRGAGLNEGRVSYVDDPDITRDRYFEIRLSRDAALK